MEARSCYNALDYAARGDMQEAWIPWPAAAQPPAPPQPGVVQLPVVLMSGILALHKSFNGVREEYLLVRTLIALCFDR